MDMGTIVSYVREISVLIRAKSKFVIELVDFGVEDKHLFLALALASGSLMARLKTPVDPEQCQTDDSSCQVWAIVTTVELCIVT